MDFAVIKDFGVGAEPICSPLTVRIERDGTAASPDSLDKRVATQCLRA